MKWSIPVVLTLTLGLAVQITVVACGGGSGGGGGDETTPGGGGGAGGGTSAGCSSADFEAQVVAFCKTQNPPSPKPGEMGAGCVDGTQCDSQYCLEPFGSSAYCTILCPNGDECPIGYSCQDTGVPGEVACYQDVCIYGGSDAADCTANLLAELDAACTSECAESRPQMWMDCLAGAGRLCGQSDASEKCGTERGLLEACCLGCDEGSIW